MQGETVKFTTVVFAEDFRDFSLFLNILRPHRSTALPTRYQPRII